MCTLCDSKFSLLYTCCWVTPSIDMGMPNNVLASRWTDSGTPGYWTLTVSPHGILVTWVLLQWCVNWKAPQQSPLLATFCEILGSWSNLSQSIQCFVTHIGLNPTSLSHRWCPLHHIFGGTKCKCLHWQTRPCVKLFAHSPLMFSVQ